MDTLYEPNLGAAPLDAGIEILVELAQSGQIDPWHVDIIDVTDKYLQTLDLSTERDLRLSGRAIFYAAVLLRLKSEALDEVPEDEQEPPEELDFCEEGDVLVIRPPLQTLDAALSRRTSTRQPRKRPTTLAELIVELQRLERQEREAQEEGIREGGILRRERVVPQAPLEMAHDEDIQGDMERVAAMLAAWVADHGELTLFQLLAQSPDPVGTFLALLFLDAEARITLVQKVFYEDAGIYPEFTDAQQAA